MQLGAWGGCSRGRFGVTQLGSGRTQLGWGGRSLVRGDAVCWFGVMQTVILKPSNCHPARPKPSS